MKDQPMQPWGASAGPAATKDTCDLHEGLRRASRGEVGVYVAFQTLLQVQEEQARATADLIEQETWALTLIIGASEAIRRLLPGPALRFARDTPTDAEGPICNCAVLHILPPSTRQASRSARSSPRSSSPAEKIAPTEDSRMDSVV